MGNALAPTPVCLACGEPLGSSEACLACLVRAGLEEADGPAAPNGARAFGDFEIERRDDGTLWELGRGAMGVTYRAVDTVLHRTVALKVIELPTSAESDAVRERFLREARAAAALRHPNVAGVFHFGASREGDRCYCAMELIEGETLEARLRRDGPLKAELALEVAIQVAHALVAAAERGLVHRDLKPGNIMLARSGDAGVKLEVKVIDFGLAKAAAGAAEMELTHGGFVGTPAFASPEQFAGGTIDARADIYALGVTLWFALTGRLPFPGGTIEEIQQRQGCGTLPLEQLELRAVPKTLINLLRSCLALTPAERPASARELMRALESCRDESAKRSRRRRHFALAAASLLLVTALGAFLYLRTQGEAAQTSNEAALWPEKSIAVLPFKPLLAEKSDPVLELGMADTLITKLSNSREIIIPSLASVQRQTGSNEDTLAIGRALGVKSVLEGTVVRMGDSIRLTVRLINVANGSALWTGAFDEKFTGIFSVQDTISHKVAAALALHLSGEERQRLARNYTENVAAYELYLTGRYHLSKVSPPEVAKSIGFFEKAVEADPGYALAYFGLAEAYRSLALTSEMPPKEVFPKGKAAATRAVQIDESLAEPHANLVMTHLFFDWNWAAAETEAKRAISLNPNSSESHLAYAQLLSTLGRHPEATAQAARGRQLDPVSPLANAREGAMLYLARRYDKARERLQRTLELDPSFRIAHIYLGKICLEQGNQEEALASFHRAREFSRGSAEAISLLGHFAGRTGDVATARNVLDELTAVSEQRYIPPYHIALVHAGLGEYDQAMMWLEKAFGDRDPRMTWLKVEPQWDSLRSDPRFAEMLRRIGFE